MAVALGLVCHYICCVAAPCNGVQCEVCSACHNLLLMCLLLVGEEVSCPICLCQFEDSEDAKILPCHHMFHTLCIQAWLNKVLQKRFINKCVWHTVSAVTSESVVLPVASWVIPL